MGLRVTRYGPLSTIVVVGKLVGTFEPALVIVTKAQASNASARTNSIPPSQPTGKSAGRKCKRTSQLSASPARTESPQASGGRTVTRAVSAVFSIRSLSSRQGLTRHRGLLAAASSLFIDVFVALGVAAPGSEPVAQIRRLASD